MPTLTITREVGDALLHLKDGRAICKVWNGKYSLCQARSTDGQIEIKDETFEALRKFKLIRRYTRDDPYIWWTNWYGRSRTYLLSDAGKEFQLPPQDLWVEPECQLYS